MPLMQLVYASRPFGFDDLALRGILNTAQRNNARDGITGSLICREDLFLQLLEGQGDVVQAAYDRICRDDRHTDVRLIVMREAEGRLFPEWAMRHDPAKSWMWSREEVSAGAVDRVGGDEALAVFSRLTTEPADEAPRCPRTGR